MCIRDRCLNANEIDHLRQGQRDHREINALPAHRKPADHHCLLYTSDAADDLLCVDLGGRRIIKKKKKQQLTTKIRLTGRIYITHTNRIARQTTDSDVLQD